MKLKRFKIPIYNVRVGLIDEDDVEVVRTFLSKRHHEFQKDYLYATVLIGSVRESGADRHCIYAIFNTKNPHDKLSPGVIAHEANHVVEFVMQHIGWEYDMDNSEPFTYLVQYIVGEINKFLNFK